MKTNIPSRSLENPTVRPDVPSLRLVNRRVVLGLVLLSYFITAIDGSIVITGLTQITADLRLSPVALSWVQNAYVLAFGGFMLLGGGLSDTLGRKRTFLLALLLFGLGSLGAGVAASAAVLVASRFVQGMGSALLAPTSLALLMDHFEGRARVKAVAWYSSISGFGLSVGLVAGGAVTSFLSWRVGFLVNLPIVGTMLALAARHLPAQAAGRLRFDLAGTLLSVGAVFALVYALDGARRPAPFLLLGLALLAAFVRVEHKAARPLMPLRLWTESGRAGAYLARALLLGALMGYNFFISEFMQAALGFSPLLAGCAFCPLTVTAFLGALSVPGLVRRFGDRRVLLAGLLLQLAGFGLLTSLGGAATYVAGIALPMLLIGYGQGIALSPLTNLGIAGVAHSDAGAASGIVNVAHQVGGAFGLSAMTAATAGVSALPVRLHVSVGIGFLFVAAALASTLLTAPRLRGRIGFALRRIPLVHHT